MKRLILISLVILFAMQIYAEDLNINTSQQNYSFDLMEIVSITFSDDALMLETMDSTYDFMFSEILYMDFSEGTDAGNSELTPGFTALLNQNYPNPFNPNTNISFVLEEASQVRIEVYNLKGQKVRSLVSGNYDSGEFIVNWNGKNDDNRDEPSGVYLYKMSASGNTQTRKMILLR
jgi:hypothetical protein